MNLKSLVYFLEVAKDLNMTSAAQRLYISQQALSLQIQKLEQYYGVLLFERHPKLQLTYAGTILAKSAAAILRENEETINQLSNLSDNHSGTLRVGISALRAVQCLPYVLPKFTQKWPNITLHFIEESVGEMLSMLHEGAMDVLVTPIQSRFDQQTMMNRIDFTLLLNEKNYLICSDVLLRRHFGDRADEVKAAAQNGTDLREFSDVPFILQKSPMTLRHLADECFYAAGFKPKVCAESNSNDIIVSMYVCHMGAFFCRGSRLPMLLSAFPDCNAFPVIGTGPLSQTPIYLMRNKQERPAVHITEFSEIMKETWSHLGDY